MSGQTAMFDFLDDIWKALWSFVKEQLFIGCGEWILTNVFRVSDPDEDWSFYLGFALWSAICIAFATLFG